MRLQISVREREMTSDWISLAQKKTKKLERDGLIHDAKKRSENGGFLEPRAFVSVKEAGQGYIDPKTRQLS